MKTPNINDAKTVGFFWVADDLTYRVIILDETRKVRKRGRATQSFCQEFEGDTPRELRKAANAEGYSLGGDEKVRRLCESAPASRWAVRQLRQREKAEIA